MSCAICIEQLQQSQQPKVLSCGHTFCLACIEHWFDSNKQHVPVDGSRRPAVRCPVCQQHTPIPLTSAGDVGLSSLPTNFALLEAVEAEPIRLCDEDDKSSSRTCPVHVGKLLEFQCKTCDGQLVCRQCVGSRHRPAAGHRLGSLASLVRRKSTEKAELEQIVMELQLRNIKLAASNAVLQLDLLDRDSSSRANSIKTACNEKDANRENSGNGKTSSETGSSSNETAILETETPKTHQRPRLTWPPPVPPNLKTKSLSSAGLERKHGRPPPPSPSPSRTRDDRQPHNLPESSPPPPPSSANKRTAGQGLPTSSSRVGDSHQPRNYGMSRSEPPLSPPDCQPHTKPRSVPPPPPSLANHHYAGQESPTPTAIVDRHTCTSFDLPHPSVRPRHQVSGVTPSRRPQNEPACKSSINYPWSITRFHD